MRWLIGLAALGGMALAGGKKKGVGKAKWVAALPLPTAAEVKGDLTRNWGGTPKELRPLLLLTEQASGIKGAARILAVVARRESRFAATAHDTDKKAVNASRDAYDDAVGKWPPLVYGASAREFGSGGLFGALAPYLLWTGVQELGDEAPLLGSPPEVMYFPRVAAFAAAVYMDRILDRYTVLDVPDIKVGWANPGLLSEGRDSPAYLGVRERFLKDAKILGIDLTDATTIPERPTTEAWPGVQEVFDRVVGTLPRLG